MSDCSRLLFAIPILIQMKSRLHNCFSLLKLLSYSFACLSLALSTATAEEPIKIELEFTPVPQEGKYVYEVCASCHLPEGWGNTDGTYPQLAGQHRNVLMRQLLDIRSGKRDSSIMYPFVQERTLGGGYQSLADVVAYISTLPMNPQFGKGPSPPGSKEHDQGNALYEKNCLACHGKQAEGNNTNHTPRLQGQHYAYTIRQVDLVTKGIRTVNTAMTRITSSLEQKEIELIVNYISHIPVPPADLAPSPDWRNPDFQETEE